MSLSSFHLFLGQIGLEYTQTVTTVVRGSCGLSTVKLCSVRSDSLHHMLIYTLQTRYNALVGVHDASAL